MDTSTIVGAAVGILAALVLIALLVVVFRWLWNTTMPEVFGVRQLTFGQALTTPIPTSILFGGHRVADVPRGVAKESAPAGATAK